MKNLAPDIVRQRLLIEGFYKINVSKKVIQAYFKKVTKALDLKMYGKPIIYATGERGKKINQGYDAFVPLIDSGISVYVWANAKFFSVVIYTCKKFDEKAAKKVTAEFFEITKMEVQPF